jgi:hypothetical protein
MARAIAVRQVRAVKKTDPNWVLRAKAHPASLTPEASAQKKIVLIKKVEGPPYVPFSICSRLWGQIKF